MAILVLLVRGITMRYSWIWYSLATVLLLNCPAQSSEGLPQCPDGSSIEKWDSCIGSAQQVSNNGYLEEYTGTFKSGKRNGQGVMTRISHSWGGEKHFGEFLNGERSGQGVYFQNSGYATVGNWISDRMNGPAVTVDPNGRFSKSPIFYRDSKPVPLESLTAEERQLLSDYPKVARRIYRVAKSKKVRPGLTVEQQRHAWEYLRRVAELKEAQRLAQQAAQQEQYRNAEKRERERIEREGDGSEDDLACKAKKLTPSTDAYRNCRAVLVADRERKAQLERALAERQEQARVERERLAALARERNQLQNEIRAAIADLEFKASLGLLAESDFKVARDSLTEYRSRFPQDPETSVLQARLEAALNSERKAQRERQLEERRERESLARESAVVAARAADPLYDAKAQCRKLGFKSGTEKFGDCVLELSRRGDLTVSRAEPSSLTGDGSADDQTCARYGYRVGTSGYSDCRLQLDMARRDYERELRQYEAARADYDRRVAEGEAEAQRARAQRQSQYGFCVAACSSRPGSTTLGCMAQCGAQSAGVSYDPGPPPTPPSWRTTYVINGRTINCNSMGSVVTCN